MEKNSQLPNLGDPKRKSLNALLQFLERQEKEAQAVVITCETCGGIDQVDLETRLCSNCRNSIEKQEEHSEVEEQSDSDRGSDTESSEEETSDEQIDDIMEGDFDKLIKGKSEDKLVEIASLLTRQFEHKEFPEKAKKLKKALEGIWSTGTKQFEENGDGKCVKCKNEKIGGWVGRCQKCYDKVHRLRKRLKPESYKKCPDCKKIKLLIQTGRCDYCYRKDLEKRKLAEKAKKRASFPINRPVNIQPTSRRAKSSQFFEEEPPFEQPKNESKRKLQNDVQQSPAPSKRQKVQSPVEEQAVEPTSISHEQTQSLNSSHGTPSATPQNFKCFGCSTLFSPSESSPKDLICMGCFKISLIVDSRPNRPMKMLEI